MISKEENQLLCRTRPDTPMGELFRRFCYPSLCAASFRARTRLRVSRAFDSRSRAD
jgi:hypothetical protein